jgi:hypothetical protein
MKTSLLLSFLFCPLLLFSQQAPITVYVRNGTSPGFNYNAFARRFQEESYMNVQLLNTALYHQQHIRKVELFHANDSSLFYSVTFDSNGRVLEERKKANYFLISTQRRTDSIQHIDTLVQNYYRQSKLLRCDTLITQFFQYQQADSSISFSRQYNSIWYNGQLVNEQNEYYNQQFLNKKINPNKSHNMVYDIAYGSKPKAQVYLQRRLKTNYDSSKMYNCIRAIQDINFYASTDSGKKALDRIHLKNHPFAKKAGSKDQRKYQTEGADFNEPIFVYDSYVCGTGRYRAQQILARTSYGYTTRPDGLYDTFFTDYHPGEGDYFQISKQTAQPQASVQRSPLLYFRYTTF